MGYVGEKKVKKIVLALSLLILITFLLSACEDASKGKSGWLFSKKVVGSDDTKAFSHWKFYEGKGSDVHDSKGNYNGVIHGAQWAKGKFDYALKFNSADYDALNDCVNMGDAADFNFPAKKSFSISAWIKSNDSSAALPIVEKGDEPGYMFIVDRGKLTLYMNDGRYVTAVVGGIPVTDDKWHYVVAVRDAEGDKLCVYVDGKRDLVPSRDETYYSLGNSEDFKIGYSSLTQTCFNGLIDEVKVYDIALEPNDISDMYEASQKAIGGN